MSKYQIKLACHWTGDGKSPETAFRPAAVADHSLRAWADTSGADPRKADCLIVATVDDKQLFDLQADARYSSALQPADPKTTLPKLTEPSVFNVVGAAPGRVWRWTKRQARRLRRG